MGPSPGSAESDLELLLRHIDGSAHASTHRSAARGVVVVLLCRHAASLQTALRLAAARLRLEQWPALLALGRCVDLAGGPGASLLLLQAMLSAWPAEVCLQLLRRRPCLADALPPEGFALLLRELKWKN